MKKLLYLFLALCLTGCQKPTNINENPDQTSQEETIESLDLQEEENPDQTTPETRDTQADLFSAKRLAWTDYSHYAQTDEDGYSYYMYPDPDVSSEIFPLDENSSPDVVLFTFDDCPAEPDSYIVEMAQLLKSKNVNAIFLANGMFLEGERGKELLKTIYDMGFEIGNHTSTHPNLRDLSYEDQYQEIAHTSQLVEEITGERPRWFRPPFGLFNMDTINICNELGLQLMTWNFGYDWMEEYQTGPALVDISLNNDYLRSGSNILMHDRSWTYEALEEMIDGLRDKGYEIVDPLLIMAQENSTEPLVEN